jgi:hypothetical protein
VRYRPDDGELLEAMAALLDDEVLPAVPAELAHKVRVAANLARILQRSAALEAANLVREQLQLSRLLTAQGDVATLRAELDRRLRDVSDDLPDGAVWQALVDITRGDLSVAKPGYDGWEGE